MSNPSVLAPLPIQSPAVDSKGFFTPSTIQWLMQTLSTRVSSSLQSVTLTGDVTGTGGSSVHATVVPGALTLSKLAPISARSILGNLNVTQATPQALTPSQLLTMLPAGGDLSGTYTGPKVTGLLSYALPALTTGNLGWTGTAWSFTTAATGTVTTVSVVTANGFQGTVANASTTPAITLQTSISGMLKGSSNAIVAASAGSDYQAPYANLSSIGSLANAAGWLHNDGAGVFTYSSPTASWPISGTPAIISSLGSLANAAGVLTNNGSGTLSWAAGGGMTNPMTTLGDIIYENATPAPARLAGPIVNGTYVLTEIVVGSASVAPVWTNQTAITAGLASALAAGAINQIPYQTGAGSTSFYSASNYGVQTYGATGVPASIAGAAGVLQGSASAIPAFTTTPTLTGTNFSGIPGGAVNSAVANATLAASATAIASGTANQIPYQTGVGATSFFSAANYGVATYGATGVPASIAGAAGVLQGSAAAIPAFTTTPTLTGTNFTGVPTSALTGTLAAAQFPAMTGDVTSVAGALATTLITTQPSVHTWTLVQTFSATDVHTLGATFTASASVSTAGYVGYNSTQLAHEFFADGLKHCLTGTIFTQTATGTNGAATAITDIMGTGVGTRVLPASWTLTGKAIRVRCAGTVTTAASPGTTVITLRLNAGTPVTIVASPSLTLTASMTNMPFEIGFLLICRSTTSIMGTGKFLVSSSTTGITGLSVLIGTVTAATVVAATSYTVQICATDGTASGTVYTTQTASVEVLN